VPKKPETLFKEKVQADLKTIPQSWWLKTQQISTVGIPDIIGCVKGKFVAIELKRDGKEAAKPHTLQRHVVGLITKADGFAVFMHPGNDKEIIAKIRRLAPLIILFLPLY
jgi:hypothetical protein